jgi:hypothetical protein
LKINKNGREKILAGFLIFAPSLKKSKIFSLSKKSASQKKKWQAQTPDRHFIES